MKVMKEDHRFSFLYCYTRCHTRHDTSQHLRLPAGFFFPSLPLFHISLCLTLLLDGYNPRRFDMDEKKMKKGEKEREDGVLGR
jgi:hypothetical protein